MYDYEVNLKNTFCDVGRRTGGGGGKGLFYLILE